MTTVAAVPEAAARTTRAREEILAALEKLPVLQGLTPDEYGWLAAYGRERTAPPGEVLFREGETATSMSILLHGEIHVRRESMAAGPLFIGRAGQISGLLPFSRMKTYGGIGFAVGEVAALEIDAVHFDAMLAAIPSMTQRCVSTLLDRVREVTRIEQQAEKLNALGKLAGNLAHELNNPASAAQRAASGLLGELRAYGKQKYELGALCLPAEKLEAVRAWQAEVQERAPLQALDVAEREDALTRWFARNGPATGSWRSTPELSERGVTADDLDRLNGILEGRGADVVLRGFASSLRAERMTEAMIEATARIFDLIGAVKDYSYMDQAPIQEVSIPQAIESTLAMLGSRLNAGIEVERRYANDLPAISAYGSELNQVWMALLENAIDSIETTRGGHGRITIRVSVAGPLLLAEIWDNGGGIAPELHDRIFEPFYTTRAPGKGLGLGLDIVQRIVRKHRGYVRVQSSPEATCFQVRLPVEQVQAY